MTDTVDGAPVASHPLADSREEHRVLRREMLHEGMVWDVVRETVAYPGGNIRREFIDHTGAVAVLALDEHDRILLIEQYRHPVATRGWELPAGLLDASGESALEAAQRELAEEADLRAAEWHVLIDQFSTPGASTEGVRVYLARDLSPTGTEFAREAEEADIARVWRPLGEAVDDVLAGRLHNPFVVSGILAAHLARERGWATLRSANADWPTRSPGRRGA